MYVCTVYYAEHRVCAESAAATIVVFTKHTEYSRKSAIVANCTKILTITCVSRSDNNTSTTTVTAIVAKPKPHWWTLPCNTNKSNSNQYNIIILRITSSNNKPNNNSNTVSEQTSKAGPSFLANETGNVELLLDLAYAIAKWRAGVRGKSKWWKNGDESRQCGWLCGNSLVDASRSANGLYGALCRTLIAGSNGSVVWQFVASSSKIREYCQRQSEDASIMVTVRTIANVQRQEYANWNYK